MSKNISHNQSINLNQSKQYIFAYTTYQMFFYIFTTAFYAVGIFVDATNNYQLTKSNNLQTNFLLCQRHYIKIKFHFETFQM